MLVLWDYPAWTNGLVGQDLPPTISATGLCRPRRARRSADELDAVGHRYDVITAGLRGLNQVWQVTLGGKRSRLYSRRIDGPVGGPGIEQIDLRGPTDVSLTSVGTLLSFGHYNLQLGESVISRKGLSI